MPEEIIIKKEVLISPEREAVFEQAPEEAPRSVGAGHVLPKKSASKTPSPQLTGEDTKKIQDLDKKHQVKALCDLAFQKGLDQAIKAARDLNNAYVLDELHDTLIDELREQLINKGRLAGEK
ncbi:MAG: hypothetical protein ABIG90_00040 [bacterium]